MTLANAIPDIDALMEITPRPDILFASGRGSWLTDTQGRRYLDFVQGWAVNCLGHCPKAVTSALILQLSKLINCSPAFYNEPMIALAARLRALSGLEKVFFTNSGAEANEGAIKLARKWGAKHKAGASTIVTMEHGFHGRTLATMAASGKPQWETLFEPKVPGFHKVPLNDLEALEASIRPDTVAVMLEPIQGEGGVYVADDDYLRALRGLCDERGILLIFDEVQTGIGRTGRMFGHQHAGVSPDIMTLGKGLGGGVPLAALLARKDIACFDHGDQGGTFNGSPLMTAVGCAVVDEVAQLLDNVIARSEQMRRALTGLAFRHGLGAVRGRGLLLALDLRQPIGPALVECARGHGLLINAPKPECLRFMPALNVSVADVDDMISRLDATCASAVTLRRSG